MIICAWNDTYATGIRTIDAQHRTLFDLVNALATAMLGGQGSTLLPQSYRKLVAYTRKHFAEEEALFAKTAYPRTEAHLQEHRALEAQLDTFLDRHESGEAGLSVHTLDFLKSWITRHIMETDMGYREFVRD